MNRLRPWLSPRKTPGAALLGLALDGNRLDAVWLRRTNGSVQVRTTLSVILSLDPLADAPELVGRELRKHLDTAGIRERRCTVCVPPGWALTLTAKLPPDLAEADRESLLQLEAERGFPHQVESLLITRSFCRSPQGDTWATLVAIPRDRIARLETVLRGAQLRPVSLSLSLAALQPARDADGVLALVPGERGVGLQVSSGGGIAALRTLESAPDTADARLATNGELLLRETRITLGLLPDGLRDTVRRVRVFGCGDAADQIAEQLLPRAARLGLTVERVQAYTPGELGLQLPPDAPLSAPLSLAVRHLAGRPTAVEFLPPRIRPWQQLTSRYAAAKLAWVGAAAGVVALAVALAFVVQHWQLARWESRWAALKPQATRLDAMQQEIRRYRPWFDDSVRSLSILRRLTEAFPEDGSVTAKTVEIRDTGSAGEPPTVSCSGSARNNQALLQVSEKLGTARNVRNVHREQTRGSATLQFTLSFQWVENTAP